MEGLRAPGIGSGLDVTSLVNQLLSAERAPAEARFASKESGLKAQLSAFGQLRSALDTLKTALDALKSPTLLSAVTASSADSTRFTASTAAGAVAGSYSVEVTALASAQKLASGAFSGPDAVVGTGTLDLSLGAATASVTIDSSNNTLAGIRNAINTARDADGKPLGITATLVTSTGGAEPAGTYLLLSSAKTGAANTIGVAQSGGDGGLAALQYQAGGSANGLTQTQAPADAVVTVDGFTYASASNSVSGALSGVTLDLKATTSEPIALTVAPDTGKVQPALKALVDAYNGVFSVLKAQSTFDAGAGTAAPLFGDSALRSLSTQLRRGLTDPVVGSPLMASAIGLAIDKDGKLTLDDAKLDALLSTDRAALDGLLRGPEGIATRLSTLVNGTLSSAGALRARTDGIDRRLSDISEQREALDARLATLEQRYSRQFNALDGLLSQMTATGNFLTQQLASLPGANSSDK
ncbi:MAG: flagellar filament capping protein FliD [Pseudomonadota bacterium]